MGAAAFREVMAPTVKLLQDLTTEIVDAGGRNGNQPSAQSRAMADIQAEVNALAGRSAWDAPLTDTHTFGGFTILAAADYGRSFADLFDGNHTPVYGHLVLARAALEACVISYWLNDPQIEPIERLQRGLIERTYSAMEEVRLNIEPEDARRRVAWCHSVAGSFDWDVGARQGKPLIGGISRPSIPAGINTLLVDDPVMRIGKVQWSYLSAVSHVTWYGLKQSVLEPPSGSSVGPSLAGLGTDSQSVRTQALCLLRALRKAGDARLTLMGWRSPEWDSVYRQAAEHEEAIIRAFPTINS